MVAGRKSDNARPLFVPIQLRKAIVGPSKFERADMLQILGLD
jgi:hypothetical protein